MSEPKSRDTVRHQSPHLRTIGRPSRDALPPLPKAGPVQPRAGSPRSQQPVVRHEGAVSAPQAQVTHRPATGQLLAFRAATAKPHVANQERPRGERARSAVQKAAAAAAALEWVPEAPPLPAPPVNTPMPQAHAPQPRMPQAHAPVPAPVVAEGSSPSAVAYVPAFEAPFISPPPAKAPRQPTSLRWKVFEQLGLGEKVTKKTTAQQWMVNTYRGLGFFILTVIVVVLVSYIATTVFYFWNDTWIQPMVVTGTDERVLSLQAQVAAQMNERDRIQADLTAVERELTVEQDFQSQFAQAIRADLDGRKKELSRARSLAYQYAGARARVEGSNSAYAAQSARAMRDEYKAGLIDRKEMLSGKFQLAQITTSNLGLAEREAAFQTRAGELDQQSKALEGLLTDKAGEGALSYDVLKIKQEYEKSRLATARASANREALRAALIRENTILAQLQQQPFLRAMADKTAVAFIPYTNLSNIEKGTTLYGCSLDMFWCHSVGKVREVLPGEVQFKHPHKEKMLRGQLVELDLDADETDALRKDVLFLGSRPLWL